MDGAPCVSFKWRFPNPISISFLGSLSWEKKLPNIFLVNSLLIKERDLLEFQ